MNSQPRLKIFTCKTTKNICANWRIISSESTGEHHDLDALVPPGKRRMRGKKNALPSPPPVLCPLPLPSPYFVSSSPPFPLFSVLSLPSPYSLSILPLLCPLPLPSHYSLSSSPPLLLFCVLFSSPYFVLFPSPYYVSLLYVLFPFPPLIPCPLPLPFPFPALRQTLLDFRW